MWQFLLLLGLLTFPGPGAFTEAAPRQKSTRFQAEYWLGRSVVPGRWNTIWVEVTTGEKVCRGVFVYVNQAGESRLRFMRPVVVPPNSKMLIPLYVRPRSARNGLVFVPIDGSSRTRVPLLAVEEHYAMFWVVGVIQDGQSAPVRIAPPANSILKSRISVERMTIPRLPDDARGYGALNCLVWIDPDFDGLNRTRKQALLTWVYNGGELVIVPGKRWRQLQHGPLVEDLPAVPVERVDEVEWAEIPQLIGRGASEAPLQISGSRFARAWRAPRSAGVPFTPPGERWRLSPDAKPTLYRERALGFGRVTVLGFSPCDKVFREWHGLEPLWSGILSLGDIEATAFRTMIYGQDYRRSPFLSEMREFKGVKAIGFTEILVFLVLFVLLIGPVDFLVLKRLDRQEWTWVTFPLMVGLAIGLSVWWAAAAKGYRYLSNSLTVVDLSPGQGYARGREWVSVFTPKAGDQKVSHPDAGSFVLPVHTAGGHSGDADVLAKGARDELKLTTRQWATSSFCTQFDLKGIGSLRLVPSGAGGHQFSLLNDTRLAFQGAFLCLNDHVYQHFEALAPGTAWDLAKGLAHSRKTGCLSQQEVDYLFGGRSPSREARRASMMASTDVADYFDRLKGQETTSSRLFRIPVELHRPGRPGSGQALFAGWTADISSSFVMEGTKVERSHGCLVRAILEVERK